jgi:hypothetical protein
VIAEEQLLEILKADYDFYFNIVDGGSFEEDPADFVCESLLKKCKVPYVSPTPEGYDPSR